MGYPGGYYGEDEVVRETLKQLIAERGTQTVISRKEISEASGIPFCTCRRSLQRLERQSRIQRQFVRGSGVGQHKFTGQGYIYKEIG